MSSVIRYSLWLTRRARRRNMKRLGFCLVVALAVAMPVFAQTGNGAPSGPHYNLNIIGTDNCPGDDLKGSSRHTIFVLLEGRSKINLVEGDFQVLDGNACDADGATYQLPANPYMCPIDDPECLNTDPTYQEYMVYARALGKPGGSSTITTCATADTGEIVCSTENVVLVRSKGKSSFSNVTKQLTTLCLDTDGDGVCDERVGLFEDPYESFFWDYDNYGNRLVQLRLYPIQD
jgi:hypothetical protein